MGEFPGLAQVSFGMVDVRDVAEAHLQGILKKEAANKRYILCERSEWLPKMSEWLQEK